MYNRAALDKISKKFDKYGATTRGIRVRNWETATSSLGMVFSTLSIDDWSLVPPDLKPDSEYLAVRAVFSCRVRYNLHVSRVLPRVLRRSLKSVHSPSHPPFNPVFLYIYSSIFPPLSSIALPTPHTNTTTINTNTNNSTEKKKKLSLQNQLRNVNKASKHAQCKLNLPFTNLVLY